MRQALLPIFALLTVLLCGGQAWAADTPSNMDPTPTMAKQDPLQSARQAIQAGQWPQALAQLTGLLPKMAGNADVHNLLGYVYRKQAAPDLAKAMEHYREALRIDPTHQGAHEYIGEAWLMLNQPDKARQHLETLRRLCGGTACEAYQDLAQAIQTHQAAQAR